MGEPSTSPLMGLRRPVVWVGFLASAGMLAYAVAAPLFGMATDPATYLATAAGALGALSLTATGAVLATRLPGNTIGWILFVSGLLFGLAYVGSTPLPFSPVVSTWVAWLANLSWVPAIVLLGIFLPLLFPTGSLPSPRWRAVVVIAIAAVVTEVLQSAFTPFSPGTVPPGVENPLAAGDWVVSLLAVAGVVATVSGVIFFPIVAASLVMRYRRARGEERAQLRWLAAALAVIGPSVAIGIAIGNVSGGWQAVVAGVAWLTVTVGLILLPIAIGIAVLRYRLYDIDLLINRTAVYGSVSVVLAAGFFVANVALQRLLETVAHQRSDLVTAGLGVSVGLLFAPMQRRMRPLVDRILPGRAELALLFNDIVGSTQRIVEIGDQRWRALLAQYLAAVRAELARYNGREINTAGDAFFATFPRPLDALQAAWTIRAAVQQLGLDTRTGLHVGEVEMRGEQVSGLAVHTAARIMAAAGDGEILVSAAIRDAVDVPEVAMRDRGEHQLKGVPGDWQLYAIDSAG
jgi:class 3 adenylate cyclase